MSNPKVRINQLSNIEWLDGSLCTYTISHSNHIWQINIPSNLKHINAISNLLTADEHERANRYYREKDKQRFILARAILRLLLARYLNRDAKQLIFEIGENKKPHVKGDTNLHYNVSHSGDYILIAISDSEVGVDVEQPDLNMHYEDIMDISYSKPEADFVKASANPLQTFYLLWTRKEALLKATAKGIDDALKHIPGIDGTHNTLHSTIGSEKDWIVQSFPIDNQHIGSIASAYSENTFWEFKLLQ
ncbi:MAG: 4'-phosphopantetheinyl transferase superfamily protein [Mucilaginibacter sp.]|uniref:4'-phosphopantetheinyl transferase family protein n=1 Tax=Mucilaginibacter sp. TaxID=1882438 RepID=UPI003265F44D